MLDQIPPVFRARIFRLMYRHVIERPYLLEGVSDGFIDSLACELSIDLFMPHVTIVGQDDVGLELYFMVSGAVEALIYNDEDEDDEAAAAAEAARLRALEEEHQQRVKEEKALQVIRKAQAALKGKGGGVARNQSVGGLVAFPGVRPRCGAGCGGRAEGCGCAQGDRTAAAPGAEQA